jgi:hypothetical protein
MKGKVPAVHMENTIHVERKRRKEKNMETSIYKKRERNIK